jgi:predicted permease
MLYAGYFATVGVPMAAGREFEEGDLAANAAAVCIVNEAFARRVFPGENPLGRTCYNGRRPNVNDTAGPRYATPPEDYRIVGVVRDSRYSNPRGEPEPVIYTTFLQTGTGRGQMVLHVRVAGQAGQVLPQIRDEVLRVDPTLPAFDVHTLAEEMDAALVRERLIAMLSMMFGGLALLLASVGLYGLLSFGVVQRTSELGVRMALGAGRGDVVWLVLREAMMVVAIGLAVGVPAAFVTARLASSQIAGLLFGLRATDPVTIAVAALGLAGVALVAAYLPARRASRVNPLTALKAE